MIQVVQGDNEVMPSVLSDDRSQQRYFFSNSWLARLKQRAVNDSTWRESSRLATRIEEVNGITVTDQKI
jgi:hypothetical protein